MEKINEVVKENANMQFKNGILYAKDTAFHMKAMLSALTPQGALALLVFYLLYTPCVAAVAAIKRELGGKWAVMVVIGQCVIAWLAAFVTYVLGNLIVM